MRMSGKFALVAMGALTMGDRRPHLFRRAFASVLCAAAATHSSAETLKGGVASFDLNYFAVAFIGGEPSDEVRDVFDSMDGTAFNVDVDETVEAVQGDLTARATVRATANFSTDESGAFSGSYSASVVSTVTDDNTNDLIAPLIESGVNFCIDFGVRETSAQFSLSGSAATAGREGDPELTIRLFPSGAFEEIRLVEDAAAPSITQSLLLPPGNYRLEVEIDNTVDFKSAKGLESATGEAQMELEISLVPGTAPDPDTFFWSVNDGDYDDASNWEPTQVPGEGDTAVFDLDGIYSVAFGSHETGRTIVERGFVTFSGGAYTLSGGDEDSGSLVVGASSEDSAVLDLRLNQLNTLHTVIGDLGVSNGSILSTVATQWTNQGRLTIGRDGRGGLAIANDAGLSTGELRLGDVPDSEGSLIIGNGISSNGAAKQDVLISLTAGSTAIGLEGTGTATLQNAFVRTGETQLGVFPGSMGSLTILESPQFAFWDLTGDLLVGNEGEAMVDIQQGGILRSAPMVSTDIVIANAPNSMGAVQVNGAFASLICRRDIYVGPGGEGILTASHGASVKTVNLAIGPRFEDDAARGDVLVQGEGAIGTEPDLEAEWVISVGSNGAGTLIALNGASILSQLGGVGVGAGGEGFLTLDNARWISTHGLVIGDADPASGAVIGTGVVSLMNGDLETLSLILENGSTIQGTGTLVAFAADLQGTVAPGLTTVGFKSAPAAAALLDDAWPVKGTDDPEPIGALNFEGDVSFDGATITIEATSASNFDQIEITGDAGLTNTTIDFVFIDGYLPQTGDELAFLTAANITIDAATTFTYTGAADGFRFDVMNIGGALMFQAQSDAQAEGGEGEGDGEGDGEPGGCASSGFSNSNGSGSIQFDLTICLVAVLLASARRIRRRTYDDFR